MMVPIILLLCFLISSNAVPMHFSHMSSNSEEGMPYGPYGYQNPQMPSIGSMYGLGFPHYSQMIQLQQALGRQPSSWLPQNIARTQQIHKETIPLNLPRFHLQPVQSQLPQLPAPPVQQPQLNPPQSKSNYVTKQPHQPLQLPPAPDQQAQAPMMFPPFSNIMNPYQPYWQQGNYFGFFGMGGRAPYNSEEINEDEEPAKAEKESPKTESPVAETSNTTIADNNSTTISQSQGNATTNNESMAGDIIQSSTIPLNAQNGHIEGPPVIAVVHNKHKNTLHGASRQAHYVVRAPNPDTILSNHQPHQKYHIVDKILVGRGGFPSQNTIYHQEQITGKVPLTNIHTEKSSYIRHVPQTNSDKIPLRTVATKDGDSFVREARGMHFDPTMNTIGNDAIQQIYRNNVPENASPKVDNEHLSFLVNKNKTPNRKIILVQHQGREHFPGHIMESVIESEYAPRGIFSSHRNTPSYTQINKEDKKLSVPNNGDNSGNINTAHIKSEDLFIGGEFFQHNGENAALYQKEGTASDIGTAYDIGTATTGQQLESIYLVKHFPTNHFQVYGDNNPKNPSHLLSNTWQKKPDQLESPRNNLLGQKEIYLYPDTELYHQTNNELPLGKQHWDNEIDFSAVQFENPGSSTYYIKGSQRQKQWPTASNNRVELDRQPIDQPNYLLISKLDPAKNTDVSTFTTNEPMAQNGYITNQEAYLQSPNNKSPFIFNKPSTDGILYIPIDELHDSQNNPVHLKLTPYSKAHSENHSPGVFRSLQEVNPNIYPSSLRRQSLNPRKTGHYSCTIPLTGVDPTLEHNNALILVCCKLNDMGQSHPSANEDNVHHLKVVLNEYMESVPHQDQTHRQHTRDVIESPKFSIQNNVMTVRPNSSNNHDNIQSSRGKSSDSVPCTSKPSYEQNSEYPYAFPKKQCSYRGDADSYLPPSQDESISLKKRFLASENVYMPLANTPGSDLPDRRIKDEGKVKKGIGKLLEILTCPQDQEIHTNKKAINIAKTRPTASLLNHDKLSADAVPVLNTEQSDAEKPINAIGNLPDCLILKK
uniref:Enamelin n=1 Tax=Xenopus tropicalis TaxID=8364 RepID=A0A803K519_XENTR